MLVIPDPSERGRMDLEERLQPALAGRYELERELGHGGMGVVFRARDLQHPRTVAIKVLRPEIASAVGPERFEREIHIEASLQHPHIVALYDSGTVDGLSFFVMPFIEGETLRARLQREGPIPIDEALRITDQVADALGHAHAHGVIHRDIKPENILLSDGHAHVADFGIARVAYQEGESYFTATGTTLGTPSYMSPEQATGGSRLDGRTDLYSLGCVLFEMLGGEPPFSGHSAQVIMSKHVLEAPPSIDTLRPSASPVVRAALLKALAKVPADRFATAGEFRAALHADTPVAVPTPAPIVPPWLRARRSAVAIGLLAVVTVGVILGPRILGMLRSRPLAASRVLVFPLAARSGLDAHRLTGEDVATIIGHSLDAAGPIHWVEGWQLLTPEQRADVGRLSHEDAIRIARREGCGHFVRGVIAVDGDSALVSLELRNTEPDTLVSSASAAGLLAEAWRVGLRALNSLLPGLIPGETRDIGEGWTDRDPGAVVSFLAGEASFRRGQFAEALEHYERAVGLDSSFALAAVRGAQASTWYHGATDADVLIDIALANGDVLAPKHRLFAEGLNGFIEGQADDAVWHLRAAMDSAPEFALPFGLLGEVYTHLMPSDPYPDSLAEWAFLEARRRDPAAVPPLFHLSEIALRKGDRAWAARLVDSLTSAEPDSSLVGSILLMRDCVLRGPDAVDGRRAAQNIPQEVIEAGKSLAVGGYQPVCAKVMFRAILDADTAMDTYGEGRRWAALMGLQNLLLVENQTEVVRALIDSALRTGVPAASRLYELDALAGYDFAREADSVTTASEERYGDNFQHQRSGVRLWLLGAWDAHRGRWQRTEVIAGNLDARGRATDSLLASALRVHAAVARSDTADALRRLERLQPIAPPRAQLAWGMYEPLAVERMLEVRLLRARGEDARARRVASLFRTPAALTPTLFLGEASHGH